MATRVERAKKMKVALNFYKNSFRMHPPYMVICDGNFIYAAQDRKIDLQEQISEVFRGKVYLKVPDCVTNELNGFKDKEFDSARRYAREKCQKFHCSHPPKAPKKCILEALRHNFVGAVGTQDESLRRLIHRDHPQIPVFYIDRGLRVLKIPSTLRQKVQSELMERYGTKPAAEPAPESVTDEFEAPEEAQDAEEGHEAPEEAVDAEEAPEEAQGAEEATPEAPEGAMDAEEAPEGAMDAEEAPEGAADAGEAPKRRKKHRKHREEENV